MTAEDWKLVIGFPDYWVSNQGDVASCKGPKTRLLVGGSAARMGYRCVQLYRDGRPHAALVHRLVARHFIGPCPDGFEVRHLNGNHLDNSLENLAYGTRSENMQDRVRHGTNPNASKTRCKRDHAFDVANTYVSPTGRRTCRTCRQQYARDFRTRRAFRAAGIAA